MYLLHLGSHRLDAAQNLILVGDSCDADSCQVTVQGWGGGGRKQRESNVMGAENLSSGLHADTHLNQP